MADAKTIDAIKKAVESAPERKFPETVEVALPGYKRYQQKLDWTGKTEVIVEAILVRAP